MAMDAFEVLAVRLCLVRYNYIYTGFSKVGCWKLRANEQNPHFAGLPLKLRPEAPKNNTTKCYQRRRHDMSVLSP